LASSGAPQSAADPLEPFEGDFARLLEDFRAEYDEYDLDEVIVGAIAQVVGTRHARRVNRANPVRQLAPWFRAFEPLAPSETLLQALQKWKRAYRYSETDRTQMSAVEVYGAAQPPTGNGQAGYVRRVDCRGVADVFSPVRNTMTPFESLIYHLWLPKVRSALK
jgi:tuftelin-interacting protein 11